MRAYYSTWTKSLTSIHVQEPFLTLSLAVWYRKAWSVAFPIHLPGDFLGPVLADFESACSALLLLEYLAQTENAVE